MGGRLSGVREIMDTLGDVLREALTDGVEQVVPRLNLEPSGVSIDIYPGDPFRDAEGAGFSDINGRMVFTVRARADIADVDGAQDALLNLMDDEHDLSVAAALLEPGALADVADSVRVDGPSGFIPYGDNPGTVLGCEWRVTVLNRRSS